MNQQIIPLENGDFEVLNEDGTVQGIPSKKYIKQADGSWELE